MNAPPPLIAPRTPLVPVAPNLRHAFGGIWRLTLRRFLLPSRWLTLLIGLAVLALLAFAASRTGGGSDNYAGWVGNFFVTFLVPALAFVVAAGAMRDEMKPGTVDYVLTRPVPRPAFVVFKFVAHTLCEQIDFVIALVVVLAIGTARGVPDLGAAWPKLLLGQVLLVTAASAFGFLAGILTSRYVVIGIAYAGVIEVGLGQIPTQLSRLSLTRQIRDLLEPAAGAAGSVAAAFGTVGLILIFTCAALAAAAVLFNLRELSAPNES